MDGSRGKMLTYSSICGTVGTEQWMIGLLRTKFWKPGNHCEMVCNELLEKSREIVLQKNTEDNSETIESIKNRLAVLAQRVSEIQSRSEGDKANQNMRSRLSQI